MNPNQQRSSWFGALLSIVMGIALVAGGGWVLARYFVHPEVDAADFRTAEHDGQYIQLNATEAYEVGFQVEYDPSDPSSKDDPANRVARLIAIPVGTQVLIVRVPMDHRGQSYAGIVKELTFDIEMALAMNDMDNVMRDSRRQIETFLQDAETARRNRVRPRHDKRLGDQNISSDAIAKGLDHSSLPRREGRRALGGRLGDRNGVGIRHRRIRAATPTAPVA